MTRRSLFWSPRSGRDKGRMFKITEMDAFSCEEWAREALGLVARSISGPDSPLLSMMASALRESFLDEEPEPVQVPKESTSKRTAEVVENVKRERAEEAKLKTIDKREDSPMNLAALLGLRIFLQLSPSEQNAALAPLMACCELKDEDGQWHPVYEDGRVSDYARATLMDARTITQLRAKAFGLHADFFTPAARSIAERMVLAAHMTGQEPATSPAPSARA
ncbi:MULTISPECIES: hypothetical protein [unclassified Saccharibacter]|uniref:hypothetical protein n=1 Tax=unclassified Saccharibacter TaxID=2648722 RepID=UPI00132979A9|nr:MULTISPECIES: hypothetical protein [unclassified Saccharibacter]MXV35672.1 hypothetical protein [Saccharibacter sp. EH611]MXV58286.1 hypothetical protein [Saccharibacter sp. EH70]MXV66417.1 hypothetical protein [Saccharibacter sp. EH60]